MALVRVGPRTAIAAGQVAEVMANGKAYAVCDVEGELYAIDGTCPHRGGPLGHGALHGHVLVCPWHAWEFDCRLGGVPVQVIEGQIYLDVNA